jgi:hypothetical protein
MPAARKTSPSSAKPRAKAARKSKVSKATRAKAARTRAPYQSGSTVRQTQTADVFGEYAERAVLIPVGAALVARDRVVSTVSDTISTYSSPKKTQAQLRRFERRGATARNRLEREVRKARVRFERELRQRRRVIEKSVNEFDSRRETVTKQVPDIANRVPDLANRVQERILSLV